MNLDNFIIVVYFVIALVIASVGAIAPHFIGLAGSGASTGLAVGCYELFAYSSWAGCSCRTACKVRLKRCSWNAAIPRLALVPHYRLSVFSVEFGLIICLALPSEVEYR